MDEMTSLHGVSVKEYYFNSDVMADTEAKEIMGKDILIVGNIPTVEIIKNGRRQEIRDAF